jgi:hypothetical protein
MSSISNQIYLVLPSFVPDLVVGVQGTSVVLNWTGIAGINYEAQYSTDLQSWLPYNGVLVGTNGPMQLLIPIDATPAKYFRLKASN